MVKRLGTKRRKTRKLFRKAYKQRGKISVVKYFQDFKAGDRVALKAEPSVHKGLYFRRFHGKVGIIKAKQGSCYKLEIRDGGKRKIVITHPVHLIKINT